MRLPFTLKKILMFFIPSVGYPKLIIDKSRKKVAFDLYPQNFGRALILTMFMTEISKIFTCKTKIDVAVVGGYLLEPEILALELLEIETKITFFGVDDGINYLNLNEESSSDHCLYGEFDLVLCSQVWEHIWNHEVALKNLKQIVKKNGYLWLACPTSNRPHSSPSYYCAGFTSEYLTNNLSNLGFEISASGQLGTKRNYRATHSLPTWLSVHGHRFPPTGAFSQRGLTPRIAYSIRYSITTILLLFNSPRISDHVDCATETWVLARN